MITKKQLLEKEIFEIPNFLTEKEATDFWYHANECTWSYGRVSNTYSGQKQSRMTYSFDPELFVRTDLWKRVEKSFDTQVSLNNAYINIGDHATVNIPHCDGNKSGPTILICINQEWKRDWGGYTVLFKSMNSNEIIKASVPEPGKALIFNGPIWHTGVPIAHFAAYPRFILTMHCFMD